MRLLLASTRIFINPWVSPFSTARLTLTIARFAMSAGSLRSRTCLKSDVASADDHQMLWQEVDIHHRAVRQIFNSFQTGKRRHRRAASDIDENFFGREYFIANRNLTRG